MAKDMSDDINEPVDARKVDFRKPVPEDGGDIWELIRECKPLDENSRYFNLIQADHFSDTCVVAEVDGEICGWISGHMIPGEEAFFVWQVAVSPRARGLGLGRRMLQHLIERPECVEAHILKTTITEANDASWALFESFARAVGGELTDIPHFEEDVHFAGAAPTEHLVSITLPRNRSDVRVVG